MTASKICGPDAFREEYTEMRSRGLSHDRIAQVLGVKRESLLRRCMRTGIYIPEKSEVELRAALDRLIASGRPFVASDLAEFEPGLLGNTLRRAAREGRIRSMGTRPRFHGGTRVQIWCAAEAGQAVAS
ncbi:hypothetical protein [Rhodococcus sp. 06-418-5]|uniref:hypothetical protein n=1 Tax=Rhodococcus sp. 06-418-5 TaxID=2022507 RepID=UPI00117B575D|nr:hypothetical protein [Rhodococcus sp. 06-418-5]